MSQQDDEYYYRLGRYQGFIELTTDAPKAEVSGLSPKQIRDWHQGYEEARAMYFWRRRPLTEMLEAAETETTITRQAKGG